MITMAQAGVLIRAANGVTFEQEDKPGVPGAKQWVGSDGKPVKERIITRLVDRGLLATIPYTNSLRLLVTRAGKAEADLVERNMAEAEL